MSLLRRLNRPLRRSLCKDNFEGGIECIHSLKNDDDIDDSVQSNYC